MSDSMIYTIGGIVLMVGLGGVAVLIVVARALARGSRGRGSTNQAWNQLGYQSQGATRYGPGRTRTHYARDYMGMEVHYLMDIKSGFGKSQQSSAWIAPLAAPARIGLQVVEAGIADTSAVGRASRAVSSTKYDWERKFEQSVQTGDSELDQRFAVFSTDADTARRWLTQSEVRASLLGLKHVDLTVAESEARLDDPFLANVWGLNGQPLVDVHNQIAELLKGAREAIG